MSEITKNSSKEIRLGFDKASKDCEALIVRSKDLVNEELLIRFPNAKAVVSSTSGFDHFDLNLVQKRKDIFFGYSPEANVVSCAELTLMHVLNIIKNKDLHKYAKRQEEHLGLELNGMHALIIGFGRIGKKVAQLLQAFGVSVSAYDPYAFKRDFATLNVKQISLEEGLKEADLISLHCPQTEKTKGLVNSKFLSEMNNEAVLINCARGALIVEEDLIKALSEGLIKGAALDVFDVEPLPKESKLWSLSNVYLSPHVGGYTKKAQVRSALEALRQVEDHLSGKTNSLTPLPFEALWFKDLGPDAY